jgi:hypothetical protein
MRFHRFLILPVFLALSWWGHAQVAASLSPSVAKYVRVNEPRVVLQHVRVIDGTGRAPVDDQNIIIERGKITALQAGANIPAAGTTVRTARVHRNA